MSVRRAVAIFEELGARPAAARAIARLRTLGVRELPPLRRGPQATTRANPAGLTRREAEVLALVAAGLRNAEIAERLYLTPKTVSHHLSAIYAKLGVETGTRPPTPPPNLGSSRLDLGIPNYLGNLRSKNGMTCRCGPCGRGIDSLPTPASHRLRRRE